MFSTEKNKAYFDSLNKQKFIDTKNLRLGQKGALNCAIERIEDIVNKILESKSVSIVEPCGYGKSHLILGIAYEAVEQKLVSQVLVVTPSSPLVYQMTSKDQRDEFMQLTKAPTGLVCDSVTNGFHTPLGANGEHFIALTTQMASVHSSISPNFPNWIRQEQDRTGKPVLVIIDECHCSSECNSWGAAVKNMMDAGAIAVLLTATPFREDGKIIPGFRCKELSRSEKRYKIIKNLPELAEQNQQLLETCVDLMSDIVLIPDYEVTLKQARDEGAIANLVIQPIEVTVSIPKEISENGEILSWEEKKSSKMTVSETRKHSGRFVRDDLVIKAHVKKGYDRLISIRRTDPKAQMIVFSCSDVVAGDKQKSIKIDNAHARDIRKAFKNINPKIKAVIVTSKPDEEHPNDKSDDLLRKFRDGDGDVLIVKQMASVGLNIPSLRVAVYLSAIRTPGSFMQMVCRVGRIWGSNSIGEIIVMTDPILTALCKYVVEGKYQHQSITIEHNIENQEIIDKTESQEKLPAKIIKAESVGTMDSGALIDGTGIISAEDDRVYVKPICELFPRLETSMIPSEIAKLGKLVGAAALQQEVFKLNSRNLPSSVNVSDERKKRKNIYNKNVSAIMALAFGDSFKNLDKKKYKLERGTINNKIKKSAGIKRIYDEVSGKEKYLTLEEIMDIESLDRLVERSKVFKEIGENRRKSQQPDTERVVVNYSTQA